MISCVIPYLDGDRNVIGWDRLYFENSAPTITLWVQSPLCVDLTEELDTVTLTLRKLSEGHYVAELGDLIDLWGYEKYWGLT